MKHVKRVMPDYFRPILWSFDFFQINPDHDKKTIIVNSINYGNLKHWQWINEFYGKAFVRNVLMNTVPGEIRQHVKTLVSIIFNIKNFNNAPRGIRRKAAQDIVSAK